MQRNKVCSIAGCGVHAPRNSEFCSAHAVDKRSKALLRVSRSPKSEELRRLRERSGKRSETDIAFASLGSWMSRGEITPAAAALAYLASDHLRKRNSDGSSKAADRIEKAAAGVLSAWVCKTAYDMGDGDE